MRDDTWSGALGLLQYVCDSHARSVISVNLARLRRQCFLHYSPLVHCISYAA